MWTEVLDMAMSNGLWAVLFLCLLVYQLKDSKVREEKYQNTIEDLSDTLTKVNKIDENLSDLTYSVVEVSDNVKRIENSIEMLAIKKYKKNEDAKNE